MIDCDIHYSLFERVLVPVWPNIRDTQIACSDNKEESAFLYCHGSYKPHFPVPAIRYEVVYPWEFCGYKEMIYINSLGDEDDPIMVACWDFYVYDIWYGKYQHCYDDAKAAWYKLHGAWRYPAPAHHYSVMITALCVDVVTGIVKEWMPQTGEWNLSCSTVLLIYNTRIYDAYGID